MASFLRACLLVGLLFEVLLLLVWCVAPGFAGDVVISLDLILSSLHFQEATNELSINAIDLVKKRGHVLIAEASCIKNHSKSW